MGKGHPKGLATLFFTEMWERLGFYLMLGILYLYIIDTERGGLQLAPSVAGEIYGTYLAFVYFTPFLGGMIADRYLGFRRSVFFGGLLMATGYFLLSWRSFPTFYAGLAALCVGNGFFKPNISAMVGNLYEPGDPKRDAGFNIFYMGINIGATLSAIVAAPLRNLWNFNYAFAAAGVGLLIATVWLVVNWKKLEPADRRSDPDPDDVGFGQICVTILLPAAVFGVAGYFVGGLIPLVVDTIGAVTFAFIVGMLPILTYFGVLVVRANNEEKPGLAALMPVFLAGGTFFMILHLSGGLMTVFAEQETNRKAEWIPDAVYFYKQKAMPSYFENADPDVPRPDRRMLIEVSERNATLFGARRMTETAVKDVLAANAEIAARPISKKADEIPKIWENLLCQVYRDDNVKVEESKDAHGVTSLSVKLEPETAKPVQETKVLFQRTIAGKDVPVVLVTKETFQKVYVNAAPEASTMPPGKFLGLLNAELITGLLNPVFVVLLTPLVVAFFAWRIRRKRAVSTAKKIFYGLLVTVVSILVMALAAYLGKNGEHKVSMMWLVNYYLIVTVGELCLSPMGLSLVTKLSPKRLVGLMMGGWFLSTSIGNKLAGFISGLEPTWQMFLYLAVFTAVVAGFIGVLLPSLNRAIQKYGA